LGTTAITALVIDIPGNGVLIAHSEKDGPPEMSESGGVKHHMSHDRARTFMAGENIRGRQQIGDYE
jgi:hypothetical protein